MTCFMARGSNVHAFHREKQIGILKVRQERGPWLIFCGSNSDSMRLGPSRARRNRHRAQERCVRDERGVSAEDERRKKAEVWA
jgi:hypothetical protein